MGGQNHQPCNRYLVESTELSKSLSLARVRIEMANVAIEDVLLSELRGDPFDAQLTADVTGSLRGSAENLRQMEVWLDQISIKLSEAGGWEPPTVTQIDWEQIGFELEAAGAVNQKSWNAMAAARLSTGFIGVIAAYKTKIATLVSLTDKLLVEFDGLVPVISVRGFAVAVEENRCGDFKLAFARLYNQWSEFQQMFLASALLSTESWYSWTNCGSLVTSKSMRKVA